MTTSTDSTVIDTPEGIEMFRILAIRGALSLEVRLPGMRHSKGSVLKLANQVMGTKYRTKVAALAEMDARLAELGY